MPRSTATLAIPADSLGRLPDGAGYNARSGQASLSVRGGKTADGSAAIIVEASCDSLQLQCERYERTITAMADSHSEQLAALEQRLEEATATRKTAEPRSNGILKALKWLAIGIFAGIFLKGIKN